MGNNVSAGELLLVDGFIVGIERMWEGKAELRRNR